MTKRGQVFGDIYRSVPEELMTGMLVLEGYANTTDMISARKQAKAALDRALEDGLDARTDAAGQRLYDPVEVVSHLKTAGRQGRDDFWPLRMMPTLRQFVQDLAPTPKVTMDYSRTFNMSAVPPEKSLRLRIPLPLSERYKTVDIETHLPAEASQERKSDGRLEIKVLTASAPEITCGVTLTLEPQVQEALPPPPDRDIYLRPKEGLVMVSDQIAALAARLSGNASPESAVRAFWNYIMDEFQFCPIHYDQVSAETPLDWVIESGIYDCQLASALFVGLCRARGIPARLVGGNFLYRNSPTNHYWAEAWLDNSGWTPFDFLSWDLSNGGEDATWREYFYGRTDARLVTECLPQSFVGAIGVAVPQAWHILRTKSHDGAEIQLVDLHGSFIYTDRIAMR
jgi:hypothetical protein